MVGTKFDALVRGMGNGTDRRTAIKGLVGGLLALGAGRSAAAVESDGSVGALGCKIQRCKKDILGQDCLDSRGNPDNHKCCSGLKCSNRRGVCVFKNNHGGAGDFCRTSNDCNQRYFCKKNQCVPDECAN